MSAFIILVFSRQKGLTLVFRNDPLESLKVSSTFDSIPFVRDYLQKEIEMQLRTLMMDELPAIIHRLSLRLWCPEHRAREDQEMAQAEVSEAKEVAVDPFASPPQDAVDARGNVLDASEISSLSLDGGSEIQSLFSQKNLLRLAALTDSHRTLSLFTPSIRDAVFRAWAGPSERSESVGTSTPATPSLLRSYSSLGSTSTTYTFSNRGSDDGNGHLPSRPSLVSMQSATTGLGLGAGRHSRSHLRKKKTRVVNLRKPKPTDDSSESGASDSASVVAASEPIILTHAADEPEDNLMSPPTSPTSRVRFRTGSIEVHESCRKTRLSTSIPPALSAKVIPEKVMVDPIPTAEKEQLTVPNSDRDHRPSYNCSNFGPYAAGKATISSSTITNPTVPIDNTPNPIFQDRSSPREGGILEKAWVLKMAGEIARRAHDEKAARGGFWSSQSGDENETDETPPPAYKAKA